MYNFHGNFSQELTLNENFRENFRLRKKFSENENFCENLLIFA
jgi:hypothetical protein